MTHLTLLTHGCGIMGLNLVDSGLTDYLSNKAKWADDSTSIWDSGEPNHGSASCGHNLENLSTQFRHRY